MSDLSTDSLELPRDERSYHETSEWGTDKTIGSALLAINAIIGGGAVISSFWNRKKTLLLPSPTSDFRPLEEGGESPLLPMPSPFSYDSPSAGSVLNPNPDLFSMIDPPEATAARASPKFSDLICTKQDEENIFTVVSTTGEGGKAYLLWNKKTLENLGGKIKHVHPLRFLSITFSQPRLKSAMNLIWNDYFKRTNFSDGLFKALGEHSLSPYVDGFSKELNVCKNEIDQFINNKNWDGLVRYLLEV